MSIAAARKIDFKFFGVHDVYFVLFDYFIEPIYARRTTILKGCSILMYAKLAQIGTVVTQKR